MFQNIFSASPWVWAGWIAALVALPILIHLINMLRHRRVPWATMQFLLQSHKRNKNWIRFRQWLLLASRISILLIILFMLAQVGCQNDQMAKWVGSGTTHHYVLVDDSFSMGDTLHGVSAMDRARETLTHVSARARGRSNQRFTLLRFSSAELAGAVAIDSPDSMADTSIFDVNAAPVDGNFDGRMEEVRGRLETSSYAVGPAPALELLDQLIRDRSGQASHVYVLSDFRDKDWQTAPEVTRAIERLSANGTSIELINCAEGQPQNLALTGLEPVGSVRVAGVPLMMKLTVKNFSANPVRNVQIKLHAITFAGSTASEAANETGKALELPTVLIDEIAAGESESRPFPVYFQSPSQHAILAELQDDALSTDNQRWSVVRFYPAARVLMIDNASQIHASILQLAIAPQGMTGIQPEIQTRDYLRDAPFEEINQFDVIYLLNVDRLDDSASRKLVRFAGQGGGVAFFTGDRTNLQHFNQRLHDEHQLFPVHLDRPEEIPLSTDADVADIVPTDHPVFETFTKTSQSMLDTVQVQQILTVPRTWWADHHSELNVLATLRGNQRQPLIVEKPLGKGKVLAALTMPGPDWSNWYRNGTFPAAMLLLENHLAANRFPLDDRRLGELIAVSVEETGFDDRATVIAPRQSGDRIAWRQTVKRGTGEIEGSQVQLGKLPDGSYAVPGVYDVWLSSSAAEKLLRFSVNVDPAESDLTAASPSSLRQSLAKSSAKLVSWDEFQPETTRNVSTSLSKALFLVLLLVLIGEQILAYRASYHPPAASKQPDRRLLQTHSSA